MTIQRQVAEGLNAMGQKQQLIETMQLEIRCLTHLAGRGPVVVEKCWVTCGKLTGRLAWRTLRGHLDAGFDCAVLCSLANPEVKRFNKSCSQRGPHQAVAAPYETKGHSSGSGSPVLVPALAKLPAEVARLSALETSVSLIQGQQRELSASLQVGPGQTCGETP